MSLDHAYAHSNRRWEQNLPSANEANEAEATANLEQVEDVLLLRWGLGGRYPKVGRGDKSEEHDEAEEDQDKEDVCAHGSNHKDEADHSPGLLLAISIIEP